ncbi:MAG TPA: dTDP-4-dehydrorhamnose reductase [Vicinamibacterales bacterium]|jgi:dTDP-4-dehydrorhamnose reductase
MKILVTGAAGQLAGAIIERFSGHAELLACSRRELDVTDTRAVLECVSTFRPDVIINCSAYNNVDRAEDDPVAALDVNAFAVRTLGRAARSRDAILVHYSTDFVFDGRSKRPYTEEDEPRPESVYAASKLLGEWFAREAPRVFVLRVESLFGGHASRSSIDRIVDMLLEGREARAFIDRTVSPSYVVDIAAATQALLERGEPGLYHCVNSGFVTWFELAQEIARQVGRDGCVVPISVRDLPLAAPRPQFAALSNVKLERAGVAMPSWKDALTRYIGNRVTN